MNVICLLVCNVVSICSVTDCRSRTILTYVWWKVYSQGSTWLQLEGIFSTSA